MFNVFVYIIPYAYFVFIQDKIETLNSLYNDGFIRILRNSLKEIHKKYTYTLPKT